MWESTFMKIDLSGNDIRISFDSTTQYRRETIKSWGGRDRGDDIYLPLLATHLDRLWKYYPTESWDDHLLQLKDLPMTFSFQNRSQEKHHHWGDLFPFQQDAVDFLTSSPRPGALLALSPRLGKTVCSLISAEILNCKKVLIVTTPTLLPTWENEIRRWTNREFQTCWGVPQDPDGPDWVISTYESLFSTEQRGRQKRVLLRKTLDHHWDLIIFDESICLKNRDAYRTQAALMLRRSSHRVWLLSGSPTSLYATDLYSQFEIIYPSAFRSYWRFANQYCIIQETVWGQNIVGDKEGIDIQHDFRDILFVRSLQEVFSGIGVDQEVHTIEMLPRQGEVYLQMVKKYIADVEGKRITAQSSIAQRIRLQQIVSSLSSISTEEVSAKIDYVVEYLSQPDIEFPVLIWGHWTGTLDLLEKRLSEKFRDQVVRVSGGDLDRDEKISSYQSGNAKILILSLGVGKFGLNLSNSRTVIYVDRTESADNWIQSFFRVMHLKMTHRPKMITLMTPGTTDELIAANLSGKSQSISQISDIDLVMLLRSLKIPSKTP